MKEKINTDANLIKEMQESERRYRALLETVPHGIQENDTAGIITFSNFAHHTILGYDRGELIGKAIWEVQTSKAEQDKLRENLDMLVKEQPAPTPYLTRNRRKDGNVVDIQVDWDYKRDGQGKLIGFISVITDITERRKAEQALRESEERFRNAFENAPICMAIVGLDERFLQVNQELCNIVGYPRDALLATTVPAITHPDDRPLEAQYKRQSSDGSIGYFQIEKRYLHRDGHVVWGNLSVSVVKDGRGKPLYYIGQLEDITERKKADQALRESEERFREMAENIREVFWLFDWTRQKVMYVSPTFEEIWGRPVQDLYHRYSLWGESVHPADRAYAEESFRRVLETEEGEPREYRIVRPDGTIRWVSDRAFAIREKDGQVRKITGIAEDITERKKLEEQLLQAQKMEAVGQLAGGIAHDFNNILTAITGYGSLLQLKMEKDDPLRTEADNILASAERAGHLTQSLLAFSRNQIIQPKPVDLNNIIKHSAKFLSRLIGEDIEITTTLSEKKLVILADRRQIDQVLINLATNARDAMPAGGQLIIQTATDVLDNESVRGYGYGKPGRYARISIRDTGAGMDTRTQERIFEPFFTTKETGKGTGLGLAIVYGIIKQHEGYVDVFSEQEKGTTIEIRLPITDLTASEALPVETADSKRGTETILIAEDDESLRKLSKALLEEFGYTVIEAANGEDALQRFWEHMNDIDLLLLDVIMPKRNGKEVYHEVQSRKPGVKVIFTSGYTADLLHKKGIPEEGWNVVYKPHSPSELLNKVRAVLDA